MTSAAAITLRRGIGLISGYQLPVWNSELRNDSLNSRSGAYCQCRPVICPHHKSRDWLARWLTVATRVRAPQQRF
jgi:hypothetical protein